MTAPTEREVIDYFFDKGCSELNQALRFYAYYESIGWVVGRNKPMQKWRAAATGWLYRYKDYEPKVDNKTTQVLQETMFTPEERKQYFNNLNK